MLKIFVRVMMLAVVLACAAPFFIKGPDGRPLMTLDDLKPDLPEFPSLSKDDEAATPAVTRVFKWQDDEGVWHFSNNPDDAEGHEVIELTGDINLIPAVGGVAAQPSGEPAGTMSLPGFTTVAPEQVSEMIDTVTKMEETVNQRKRDIDAAIAQ